MAADPAAEQPIAESNGAPSAASPALLAAPVKRGGVQARWVVLVLVGILVLVAAVGALSRGNLSSPSGSTTSANLPPAGSIWFGTSFDPNTFELAGQTTSIGSNAGFSAVAHLTRVVNGSGLNVRVYFNEDLVSTTGVSWTGSGDVWGFSPGPLFAAGTWKYEITDVGGNVLAAGSIHAD
jgi:hypothetical protein